MSLVARLAWSHFFAVIACGIAHADDGLFAGEDVLDIVLTGPVAKTLKDKRRPEERAFRVAVGADEWPVEVRTRGKSRLHYCRFPPLRLNFDETEVTSGPFAGLDKVKLVTRCSGSARSLDDLFEEYVAYRFLNAVTPLSHRVRMLRIHFVDSDKPGREPDVRYAFALESVEQVAHRNGADFVPLEHLVVSRVNREQAALVFVFQYLIANIDWSLVRPEGDDECCHNINVLTADGEQLLVPYDFDLSGLVDARYAKNVRNLRTRSVRDRQYMGYCLGDLDLGEAIAAFRERREPIMAVVDELNWHDATETQKRIEFLEAFFTAASEAGLAERLATDCVGR